MTAPYDLRPPFTSRLLRRAQGAAKPVAQGAISGLVGLAGHMSDRVGRRPTGPHHPPRRILVIRVDLIGDVVLTLAGVRALKRTYPEAEIDMLVLPSSAGILAGQREVTNVLPFDPYLWRHAGGVLAGVTWREAAAIVRELRVREYDVAISVSGDIASILARLSGAPVRIGYEREAYPGMLTTRLPGGRYLTPQHEIRYVLDLARAAGAQPCVEEERASLVVLPQAAAVVRRRLDEGRERLGRRGPIVTMHPGARNGQAKRWPTSHLARLADRLTGELDALVVLTGAPSESGIADEVVAAAESELLNLCGGTTLPELAALLRASDVVVTGDSGPMHIACAVGAPVVALHGPTDPGQSGPTSPSAIVVRQPLWCSPCYDSRATAECRFGNPVCMKEIAPDVVYAAVLRQLARTRHRPDETAERAAI